MSDSPDCNMVLEHSARNTVAAEDTERTVRLFQVLPNTHNYETKLQHFLSLFSGHTKNFAELHLSWEFSRTGPFFNVFDTPLFVLCLTNSTLFCVETPRAEKNVLWNCGSPRAKKEEEIYIFPCSLKTHS